MLGYQFQENTRRSLPYAKLSNRYQSEQSEKLNGGAYFTLTAPRESLGLHAVAPFVRNGIHKNCVVGSEFDVQRSRCAGQINARGLVPSGWSRWVH